MWLVMCAMRRPITVLAAMLALAIGALLAIRRMPVDIFPALGAPAIYVAQPYSGMDPQQMEGFLTYYFEYHFLYITGIEHVESKSIQGAALMKLVFHDGTDMSQAMAQVVGYVNRARSFMPPGAVPPFIVRYDAGSVPVGELVFDSPTRTPAEMQDFALNRVRPLFATLEGVSAPPPFGGNQRTIVVRLNPDRLNSYNVSPEEAIAAVNRATLVMPSGVVRTGDLTRIASTNTVVGGNLQELAGAPIRTNNGATVYLRDVGTVENGTDILVGYAHVNGKRTVYIPVTKRADASTLAVIDRVKAALPAMRAVVPDDVSIRLEFDQSNVVVSSIETLLTESLLGALLTGLMVLLFLRDWRSALIVVITIPFALLGSVVILWLTGQTINIMTLGGLALAVGVLVDEATVEIENMHANLASDRSKARAVINAARRTALPRLLSMLCVAAVFVPSFFMVGVGKQLFLPLSLAVGFALFSSYILSSTLVPVLSTWFARASTRETEHRRDWRDRFREIAGRLLAFKWPAVLGYFAAATGLLILLIPSLPMELFPLTDSGQLQIRLRAPAGTRIERTEPIALKAIDIVRDEVGPKHLLIESDYVGVQPASYPVNTIYLFTSGPQEAVLRFGLSPDARYKGEELKQRLRERFAKELPNAAISFEAADIINQVMSFGSPTPIEVAMQGPSIAADREFAEKVRQQLARLPSLRDLQYAQPLDYPTVQVNVDRGRAGQFGLSMSDVAKSLVTATGSSRFVDPNYWRDPVSGNGFQIQVEIPQNRVASVNDVASLRVSSGDQGTAQLADVADLSLGKMMGEVDRYNMQRLISLTANLHGSPLGVAVKQVRSAIAKAGPPPKGVTVAVRGQVPALEETVKGLEIGLGLALGVIFLLVAANFQSFRLGLAVLATGPAVICGVAIMLTVTRTTLNVQSFMGAIMAVGVAVANSILFLTFAEAARYGGASSLDAALEGAGGRVRAIVMTASAMIAGMLPMAIGWGQNGAQTAPLGRAVIGGLAGGTLATLFFLPSFYAVAQGRASRNSPSLDPADAESREYVPA
jgi:multidrug efflux pump subunit AcrB